MLMISGLALLSLFAGVESIKFKQIHPTAPSGVEAFPAPLLLAQPPAATQTGYYQAPIQEAQLHTTNEGTKGGEIRYEATKSRAPAAPAYAHSYAAPPTLAYVFLRPIQYLAPLAVHHEQHYSEPIRQSTEQLATKGAPIQETETDSSASKGAKITMIRDSIDRLTSAALSKLAFSSYRVEKEELLPPPQPSVPEPVQQQIKEQEIIQENEPLQQTQEQEPVKGRDLLAPVQLHQEAKGREIQPIQQQQQQQELKGQDLHPIQQQHDLKELPPKQEAKGRDLPPPVQQQEEAKPAEPLEPQREVKGRPEILPIQQQREIPTPQQEEKGRLELTQSQHRQEAKGREQEPVQQKHEAKGRDSLEQKEVKGKEILPIQQLQHTEVKGLEPAPLPPQKEIKSKEIEPVQPHQHFAESKGREVAQGYQLREAKGRELPPLRTAQIHLQEHNEPQLLSQLPQEKFEDNGPSQTRENQQEEGNLRELPQPILREQEPDLPHDLRANANVEVSPHQDDYARGPIADWTLRRPQNRLRAQHDLGLGRRS